MACIRRVVRPLIYYILTLHNGFLTPCSCMILRPSSKFSKAHGTTTRWSEASPVTARSSSSARVPPARLVLMTRGFGPSKPDRKAATTGEALARAMQDKYEQLRREGGTVAQAHARIKGTDRWYVVGYVCTEQGKTAEGIQGQKRLLLDHAAKMHSELNSKKLVLETGYSLEGDSEVVPCKAKYSGEKVGVALDPLPDGPVVRKMLEGGMDMKLRAAKSSAAESRIKYT